MQKHTYYKIRGRGIPVRPYDTIEIQNCDELSGLCLVKSTIQSASVSQVVEENFKLPVNVP